MSTEHDVYENEDLNIFDGKEEAEVEGGKKHSYLMDERETVLLYSEIDNAWTISTNVRKHITKLMKRPETYKVIRRFKSSVFLHENSNIAFKSFNRCKYASVSFNLNLTKCVFQFCLLWFTK